MSILYRLALVDYSYAWNQQSVPVLKGLNLQVQKGCFLCLVGPSGNSCAIKMARLLAQANLK